VITLDGADLLQNYTHMTCGTNIVDPDAIDPQTGLLIRVDGSMAIQSWDHCHVFKFMLAKDSQQLYNDYFKAFFNSLSYRKQVLLLGLIMPQDKYVCQVHRTFPLSGKP
jgi:hypothetical protein